MYNFLKGKKGLCRVAIKLSGLAPQNLKQVSSVSESCYLKQRKITTLSQLSQRTGKDKLRSQMLVYNEGWMDNRGPINPTVLNTRLRIFDGQNKHFRDLTLLCVYFTLTFHSATGSCWSWSATKCPWQAKTVAGVMNRKNFSLLILMVFWKQFLYKNKIAAFISWKREMAVNTLFIICDKCTYTV